MADDGKTCPECSLYKTREHFSFDRAKSNGMATYCKPCQAIRKRKHYEKNTEHLKKASRDWYRENKLRAKENADRWRRENKARLNKARNIRHHERMSSDPLYRLDFVMRASLRRLVIKGGSSGKLGYNASKLLQRIEFQFKEGMSWGNYGEWEIDHKIPMSTMLARGEVRPHVINALSNLQPMWKFENRSKGNRYVG